jgi:5'(3')-deoxyribonucleotidase
MTDEFQEAQRRVDEERTARIEAEITAAAERRRNLLLDIDAEIERGRWFIYARNTEKEEVLTAEEMKAMVLSNQMSGKPEDYTAVDPEAEMTEAMRVIMAAQKKMRTILQKVTTMTASDPLETPRV